METCVQAADTDKTPRPAVLARRIVIGQRRNRRRTASCQSNAGAGPQHALQRARLLFSVGTLRLLEGKNEDAIRLMRRTLELDPRHIDAMNNLSLLLSQNPQTIREAITYIDRAIEIAGESPELLDSKGWLLFKQGMPAEAEKLFQEALSAVATRRSSAPFPPCTGP